VAGIFEGADVTKQRTALTLCAVVLGVVPLVACGSDRSALPTAPASTLVAPATAAGMPFEIAIAGGRITAQTGTTTTEAPALAVTSVVSGTSCPSLQFMINNYLIKTDSATAYSGGSCADIKAGTKLGLIGTLSNQTQLLFYATKITLQSTTTTPAPEGRPVETEGNVTGTVTGSCPAVQFALSGWSGYVFKTTTSTLMSGGTCTDIKTGAKIAVGGTKLDGVATLTKVTIKSAAKEKEPATSVSGDTAVTGVVATTSCPALTFMLGTYTVTASSATVYEGGTCASIIVGAKIRLSGLKSELTIQATKVQFKSTESAPKPTFQKVEGEGVISSLTAGTSCPALGFAIDRYAVTIDAATVFDSGACADLKAGLRVHVKGSLNSDGSVAASRINVQHAAPHPEAEGEGVVTGMVAGSSCPALKFLIGEYTIIAATATQFPSGNCGDIAVGTKVNVKGVMTDPKTVEATRLIVKK
jgi:hypothetical protein